ncbi:MAG: DUF488 family protein [Wenzhouxiangellaceae bacterium]|nr:DUF488 family protein [Wenzhouxiangellaceae bacterium]
MIRLKRIYDEFSEGDGKRVLVDRLWPRGISKQDAALDEWCKEVTPSDELRKWFHDDPENRWPEFRERYREELAEATYELDRLAEMADDPGLTLLTAAKNRERNHTVVLKEDLEERR